MRISLFSFFALTILAAGCKLDPTSPGSSLPPALVKAVYVLNEGNFGDPFGARLSIYDVDRDSVYINVYEAANNGQHLGSLGDDIKIHNGNAYILMSGSENLAIINLATHALVQTASFPGDAPHDILIDSVRNKIYVTRLFKSSLLVLNLTTLGIVDSIPVGNNPQGLLLNGSDLYVCNSGYGLSKTVSVVDVDFDSVKATLTLSDGPTQAAIGSDGKLWVACSGNAFGVPSTTGKVFMVNTSTLAVEDSIQFFDNLWGSLTMGVDGYAYIIGISPGSFFGGPIHRVSVQTRSVQSNYVAGTFYAMAVDFASGDLYLADAKNFTSDGEITILSRSGPTRTFAAQKGPGALAFKR